MLISILTQIAIAMEPSLAKVIWEEVRKAKESDYQPIHPPKFFIPESYLQVLENTKRNFPENILLPGLPKVCESILEQILQGRDFVVIDFTVDAAETNHKYSKDDRSMIVYYRAVTAASFLYEKGWYVTEVSLPVEEVDQDYGFYGARSSIYIDPKGYFDRRAAIEAARISRSKNDRV